jgi:hypothetical protein
LCAAITTKPLGNSLEELYKSVFNDDKPNFKRENLPAKNRHLEVKIRLPLGKENLN